MSTQRSVHQYWLDAKQTMTDCAIEYGAAVIVHGLMGSYRVVAGTDIEACEQFLRQHYGEVPSILESEVRP